jgi:hypothetical protein
LLVATLSVLFAVSAVVVATSDSGQPDVAAAGLVTFDESSAELTDQDAYTQTYTDAQGVNRTYIAFLPERVMRDGEWVQASSKLETASGGSIVAPLHSMEPVFAAEASDDTAVTLTSEEHQMQVGLVGLNGATPEISEQQELGSEHSVTYDGALDGDDVVFSLDNGTMREAVVLTEAPGTEQPTYEWRFSAPGLEARETDFGVIEFVDDAGEVKYSLYLPLMWDSAGENGYVDSPSLPVDYTFEATGDGKWVMTLHPDLEWLNASERVYPVYVDPQVNIGAAGVATYKEDNFTYNHGSTPHIGNSQQNSTCCAWRTVFRMNLNSYFNYRLVGGNIYGARTYYSTGNFGGNLYWANAFRFDGNGSWLGGFTMATGLYESGTGGFDAASHIVNNDDIYSYNMLTGEENNAVYSLKRLTLGVYIDYVNLHTIGTVTGPTGGVEKVNMPLMSATGTVYSGMTQQFQYVFTSNNGGTTFESQWVGAGNYRVPDGALTPGKRYAYTVKSRDTGYLSPIVSLTNANWYFFTDAAPAVPTSIAVEGEVLDQPRVVQDDRPTLSATVADPDGGDVQALFTVMQDGIVIMDSVAGSKATVTKTTTGVSSVELPYALSPGSTYTVRAVAFSGSMAGESSSVTSSFTVDVDRTIREIPGEDDDETGAAS